MTTARTWSRVLLALAMACSGTASDPGKDGSNGKNSLVRTEAEPPGANCPAGGVAVRVGLDANGNGVLDDGEVSATSYVCNGVATLFSTESLAAGNAHCSAGGVALHHGLDVNGNGVLDPAEVAGTEYVCDGAPGANGLVAIAAEAPGANCASGGQAIRSGIDVNRDGLLQPGEVTSTAYVCNGAAGLVSLVRQDDEPAGTHCAFGGKSISSGVDANRNGVLDPLEVGTTSYVCNGATGAPGAKSLVALSPEPAGENCPAGGQKVQTGVDANWNGTLDAEEVRNSAYLCSGANRLYATSNAQWGGVCARGGVRWTPGSTLTGTVCSTRARSRRARRSTSATCSTWGLGRAAITPVQS